MCKSQKQFLYEAGVHDDDNVNDATANCIKVSTDFTLAPLQYMDVVVAGNRYKALVDSETEVPFIRSGLL